MYFKDMKKALLLMIVFVLVPLSAGAIEEYPQSEIDFTKRAIKDGFYDLAENKLNLLLKMDIPKRFEAEAHILLGRVYYSKALPQKAISEFNSVLDHYRNSGFADQATYWIAEVYFKEKKFEQALT